MTGSQCACGEREECNHSCMPDVIDGFCSHCGSPIQPSLEIENYTPTPWRVYTNKDGTKLVGIGAADGAGILDAGFGVWSWNDPEGIANAHMVVKAVNSHAMLVKAIEDIKKATLEGRVCDDVAWFSQIETLHDFCERTLGRVASPPLSSHDYRTKGG